MKITSLHGYHVGFQVAHPLRNSHSSISRRQSLIVEVRTDKGLSGWGETITAPAAAGAFVQSTLAPVLAGARPLGFSSLYHRMIDSIVGERRGIAMMAVSAIDIAVHDVAARAHGVSVAEMLGGAIHSRLGAYASGPFLSDGDRPYADLDEKSERLVEQGYRIIKPRVGVTPTEDGEAVTKLRRHLGPSVGIAVDMNRGYSPRAAVQSAALMAEAGLLWIEEPVPPDFASGYADVSRSVCCDVAGGEAVSGLTAFRDLLTSGAISIAQPDLSVCGGFSGAKAVAAVAESSHAPVAPHIFGGAVNFAASMQYAATLPSIRGGAPHPFPLLEIDVSHNPLLALAGPVELGEDGTVAVPQSAGLGIDMSAEALSPWLLSSWEMSFS